MVLSVLSVQRMCYVILENKSFECGLYHKTVMTRMRIGAAIRLVYGYDTQWSRCSNNLKCKYINPNRGKRICSRGLNVIQPELNLPLFGLQLISYIRKNRGRLNLNI
jgi:hypothetical protein